MPKGKVHQKMVSAPKKKFWNSVAPAKFDRSKCEVGIDTIGNSGFAVSATVPVAELSQVAKDRLYCQKVRLEVMLRGESLKVHDAAVARAAGREIVTTAKKAKEKKGKEKESKSFDKKMLAWLNLESERNS